MPCRAIYCTWLQIVGINGRLVRSMQQLKDGIADAVAKDGKVTLMVDHFQRQTDHGTPVPTDGDGSNAADDLTQYMPSYLQEPQTQVQEAVAVPEEHNGTDSEADDRAGDGSGSGTPWLHESLSTPEADALLVGDGDAQDGTFIVRVRRKQTLPTYTCVYHSCRHMLATGRCGVPWVWWLLVWCTLGLVVVGVVYLGFGGCWCGVPWVWWVLVWCTLGLVVVGVCVVGRDRIE